MQNSSFIHIDCDCFFAAVEMRDRPELAAIPIAIAGDPKKRGVVATCNYQARTYGVRSAMASAYALQLCPNLTLIKGNMNHYKTVSAQVMAILKHHSSRFERVSIDEAYLQVKPDQDAIKTAEIIRQHVQRDVGITVSAGVAPNKMLAKIASDWKKPNGMFVIQQGEVEAFMHGLAVRKIPGVGEKFEQKLQEHNIHTCFDAQQWPRVELIRRFGNQGARFFDRVRGIDNRGISEPRARKSISLESTFSRDMDIEHALTHLPELYQRWRTRVNDNQLENRLSTPFVKVKFADFSQTTLSDQQRRCHLEDFTQLLKQAMQRHHQAIRLIGIGAGCSEPNHQQIALF